MTAAPFDPSFSSEPNGDRGAATAASEDFGNCPNCARPSTLRRTQHISICEFCLFGLALDSDVPPIAGATDGSVTSPRSSFQIGNYSVLEEIGRGAMGVIYRAVHRATQEVVAIKTVLPEDQGNAEVLERFRREALAASSLDHPHSMPIYEVGCTEMDIPYFSMKLAEGGSLHDLGAKYRGRWRQSAELMVKISHAVHQAHERGLLHRDLKPSNILFTRDHEPLVTDYGLVKELAGSDRLTHSHAMLGTPSYIAPEQAAGKTRNLTVGADVYSLGAILFELLTGRPPFVGDNVLEILQQVTRRFPVRPRKIVRSIPKDLESICMRCLEREPADRYTSALDLADELETWLDGRRINSRSLGILLYKTFRRYSFSSKWTLGLLGILPVLLVAGSLVHKMTSKAAPATSVAVAIESLGQEVSLKDVVQHLTVGLRSDLSDCGSFKLLGEVPIIESSSNAVFDPLAYGRAANAQMVLSGVVCCRQAELRFTTRLIRCDTGVVVWINTSSISSVPPTNALETLTKSLAAALERKMSVVPSALTASHLPRPEALAFYNKAMELTIHKNPRDMKAAVDLFKRACECEPHYVPARSMLALALLTQATMYGETDLFAPALAAAGKALKEDPNSPQAHRVAGACYFKQYRYEEALSELWRGVELDPQAPGCIQALGVCLREMGKPEQALPWLTRAARLAPSRGAFATSLGETLALCARDDDADHELQHAAELDQDRPDALIAISALRTWQRAFPDARRLCDDVRQRFPESRNAVAVSAWISLCDGSLKDAKSKYEVLRNEHSYQTTSECFGAVNPSSALAYIAKQENLLQKSHDLAEEAVKVDQDLLDKNPKNLRVLHDLAATFAVMGDLVQAQRYLDKALSAGWVEHRSTGLDPRFSPLANTKCFQSAVTGTSTPLKIPNVTL